MSTKSCGTTAGHYPEDEQGAAFRSVGEKSSAQGSAWYHAMTGGAADESWAGGVNPVADQTHACRSSSVGEVQGHEQVVGR